MLKSFDEYLTERLFAGGVKRASGETTRLEDGKRVHTRFGDVIVHNTEFDYDGFISFMLDNMDYKFHLCMASPLSLFNQLTIQDIRNGEELTRKLISDNKDNDIATVLSFEECKIVKKFMGSKFQIFINQGFDEEIYDACMSVMVECLQKLPVENCPNPQSAVFRVLSDVDLEEIITSGQYKNIRDHMTIQFPGCDFRFMSNKASGHRNFLSVRIDAYTTLNFEKIQKHALEYLEQLKNEDD